MQMESLFASYLTPDLESLVTGRILSVLSQYLQEQDRFITTLNMRTAQSKEILDAVLSKDKEKKYTKVLKKAHKYRKKQLKALINMLSAIATKEGEHAQAAAEILAIIRKHIQALSRYGYSTCSQKFNLLISEFSLIDHHIKTAGAEEWVRDFIAAHDAFKEVYKNKITYTADKTLPTLREASQNVIDNLQLLLGCVKVLGEEYPNEFTKLIAELNEIISDIMTIARLNKSRGANDDNQDNNEDSNAA